MHSTGLPLEESFTVLEQCDWIDKTLWVSRQLFGGQSVNGFLRATATVQRMKKQRARQTAKSKDDKDSMSADKKRDATEQEAEEALKQDVMNTRTAKKMKSEMEMGMAFCAVMHETVRRIIHEMEPGIAPPPPLPARLPGGAQPLKIIAPPVPTISVISAPPPLQPAPTSKAPPAMPKAAPPVKNESGTLSSSGQASGSTLRKQRKKKLPPSHEPPIPLPEFDASGKRVCSKKEYHVRVFELLRFRPLKKGDLVAARLTSRDLWILATVLEDYPGHRLGPTEFLALSQARRDQLFREKVKVQDVEDKDHGPQQVMRSLVLPLPRSFSEAAEWCAKYKKGSRVYAMYPHTTSLYSATVVDCTTYCRGDDDIVVVEFDGDEPDATGSIPACHIPARFVTLIPRDFPASQPPGKAGGKAQRRGTNSSAASNSGAVAAAAAAALEPSMGDFDELDLEADLPGLDFDDLDFAL